MKVLLDTAVLIYLGTGDSRALSNKAIALYQDTKSELFVSPISYWEIAIKMNIGKLGIPIGLNKLMAATHEAGIQTLPVHNQHILRYEGLALKKHRDPFDRMLVAICLKEGMSLLSSDKHFDQYKIKRVW